MANKEEILIGITEYGADAAGENITIKLLIEPEEQSLTLIIPYHRIWKLMDGIRNAASLAVQRQQNLPHSERFVLVPYVADSVAVGHYANSEGIALQFQTSEGIPLSVAMNREAAETTILLLESELTRLPDGSKHLS
jgi:hypothetical protein